MSTPAKYSRCQDHSSSPFLRTQLQPTLVAQLINSMDRLIVRMDQVICSMDRVICSMEHSGQRNAQMRFPNQMSPLMTEGPPTPAIPPALDKRLPPNKPPDPEKPPFTPPEEDTATTPELPVSLARQPPDTAINSIEVATKDFFRWFPTIIQLVDHMYGKVSEQQTSLKKSSKNTTWFQHRPPHHHSERGKGLPKVKMKH